MPAPIAIDVTYDSGTETVTCVPDTVTVRYEKNDRRPFDSSEKVRWDIHGRPNGATVKIMWDVGGPFPEIVKLNEDRFAARGNTRVPGVYKYAVLFVDNSGQVIAGMDPDIINDPLP